MSSSTHIPGTVFEECPACGSAVWDNRDKIESGEWSAKSPHFTCRDKNGCGWVSWPERKGKGRGGAARATKAPSPVEAATIKVGGRLSGGYSFADLVALAQACYTAAQDIAEAGDPSQVFASLFKHCSDKHIPPPERLLDMPRVLKKQPDNGDPGMEQE